MDELDSSNIEVTMDVEESSSADDAEMSCTHSEAASFTAAYLLPGTEIIGHPPARRRIAESDLKKWYQDLYAEMESTKNFSDIEYAKTAFMNYILVCVQINMGSFDLSGDPILALQRTLYAGLDLRVAEFLTREQIQRFVDNKACDITEGDEPSFAEMCHFCGDLLKDETLLGAAYLLNGCSFNVHGYHQQAIECLTKATEIPGNNNLQLYQQLAHANWCLGKKSEALKCFELGEKYAEKHSLGLRFYLQLSEFCYHSGRFSDALFYANKHAELYQHRYPKKGIQSKTVEVEIRGEVQRARGIDLQSMEDDEDCFHLDVLRCEIYFAQSSSKKWLKALEQLMTYCNIESNAAWSLGELSYKILGQIDCFFKKALHGLNNESVSERAFLIKLTAITDSFFHSVIDLGIRHNTHANANTVLQGLPPSNRALDFCYKLIAFYVFLEKEERLDFLTVKFNKIERIKILQSKIKENKVVLGDEVGHLLTVIGSYRQGKFAGFSKIESYDHLQEMIQVIQKVIKHEQGRLGQSLSFMVANLLKAFSAQPQPGLLMSVYIPKLFSLQREASTKHIDARIHLLLLKIDLVKYYVISMQVETNEKKLQIIKSVIPVNLKNIEDEIREFKSEVAALSPGKDLKRYIENGLAYLEFVFKSSKLKHIITKIESEKIPLLKKINFCKEAQDALKDIERLMTSEKIRYAYSVYHHNLKTVIENSRSQHFQVAIKIAEMQANMAENAVKLQNQYDQLQMMLEKDPLTLKYGKPHKVITVPFRYSDSFQQFAAEKSRAKIKPEKHFLRLSVGLVFSDGKYDAELSQDKQVAWLAVNIDTEQYVNLAALHAAKKYSGEEWGNFKQLITARIAKAIEHNAQRAPQDRLKFFKDNSISEKFDVKKHFHSEQYAFNSLNAWDIEDFIAEFKAQNESFVTGCKVYAVIFDFENQMTMCGNCKASAYAMQVISEGSYFVQKLEQYLLDHDYILAGNKRYQQKLNVVTRIAAQSSHKPSSRFHRNPKNKNIKELDNQAIFEATQSTTFASGSERSLKRI